MLNIAMVQVGNYLGRGAEYTAKLFDGVRRYMPKGVEYEAACFTDGSSPLPGGVIAKGVPAGVEGWWAKVAMFRPGAFRQGDRVLFFDLDTIICGDLTDIAAYNGRFAALHDFFHPQHLGSACMAWEAGTVDHIWSAWDAGGRPQFDQRGDQFWIETVTQDPDHWQDVLPGQFVSYKVDCWLQGKIPAGTRVIGFHGHPRPHECRATFIEDLWRRPLLGAAA
jgi:hypothetical protein